MIESPALVNTEDILKLQFRRFVRNLMFTQLREQGCQTITAHKPRLVERDGHEFYLILHTGE